MKERRVLLAFKFRRAPYEGLGVEEAKQGELRHLEEVPMRRLFSSVL